MDALDINILKKLGKATNLIKQETQKIPGKGTKISEIIDFVENKIIEYGYLPAFPCTVCVNEVAAHYTIFDKEEDYELKAGDLIKIDFGLVHDGFITDNAFSMEIETNNYKDLLDSNILALDKIIDKIQVGMTLNDVGKVINDIAEENKFNTIHNLSGHQIGKNNLHYGIHTPNYANGSQKQIEENMEIAIEPFFTTGSPMIKSGKPSNILHLIKDDVPIRDSIARNILTYIKENYPKLPFSKRWLLKKFNKRNILYAIKLLKAKGIIHEYEQLVSVDDSFISQFEDTIVFDGKEKIVLTRL